MPLTLGTKLGPYEILAAAGAGGMGEVYRARDTRLGREVAIKILPAHLAGDAKFRERFEREARAISSLKHPNICVLYDVGHQDGVDYLVLEYLQGESLADRLQRGPLSMEQVLAYGIQIGDALERAHRQGVVHRDLKPSNVMITKDGLKLLDFGLAKPMAGAALASSALDAMTASRQQQQPLTAEGTIVGTFQYMAPEQIEGRDADPRSDLFALGCVLYEMATARRPFDGKTQASVVAAILATEPPPISTLQPLTPPAFERVVKTALAKDPDERWQSAHDLKMQLKWIAEGSQAAAEAIPGAKRSRLQRAAWPIASALLLFALIAVGASWWGRTHQAQSAMYFNSYVPFPANDVALSPDGKKVALVAYSDQVNRYIIWVHDVGGRNANGLAGTEGASHPFWSPDGRYIGFFSQGKLKKVDLTSPGSVQVICDAPHGRGGTWNKDGVIIFGPDVWTGLQRVSAGGGTPVEITKPDPARAEMSNRWPAFLPDGKHFIYLAANFSGEFRINTLYVGSLDSNEKKLIASASSNAVYTEPGYLIFLRDTTLLAQKFDLRSFSLTGDARTLATDVQYFPQIDLALFSAANGTLVLQAGKGAAKSQLTWFDRSGKQVGVVGTQGVFADPAISPDGRRVAFDQMEPDGRNQDVWVRELGNDAAMRLTFGPGLNELPQWAPDGKRIAIMSNQKLSSALHLRNADGSGSDLPVTDAYGTQQTLWGWSPDGRYLLAARDNALAYVALGEQEPKILLQGSWIVRNAQFSPDGKWIAYASNEAGAFEIYVSPFPNAGSKWQVSRGGGEEPRWRHDGKELFYLSSEGKMMAASVKTGTGFESGTPVTLFQAHVRQPISSGDVVSYDVAADGQRFLINTKVDDPSAAPLSVILNWASEMEK